MRLARLAAWIRRKTGLPDRRPAPGIGNNYDWFMREISGDARHPSTPSNHAPTSPQRSSTHGAHDE